MKKSRFPQLISLMLLSLVIHEATAQNSIPIAPLLLDSGTLATTKSQLEQEEPRLQKAYAQLILAADKALLEGPFSVTDKTQLPPSGNKNDYASYSRYWWPDPTKADGLPYIRRDGETYPGSQSLDASDRQRIGALGENIEALGLAYYFTGKEKYAQKVAQLLRVWFLDKTTRMNPNLNHAQCRPGHNTGSKSGVLDGRIMIKALEASLLIEGSKALSKEEKKGLKRWAEAYFEWLTSSELALQEAASKNNHGSYYDLQALYFALYAGKKAQAQQIAQDFYTKRILKQIQADGSMPEEMARTRPLFYSIYNLNALFLVAHLAEKVGEDLWKTNDPSSRLRTALDYLVPYTDPDKSWPHPTLRTTNRMDLFQILQLADRVYPTGNYLDYSKQLPQEDLEAERSLLAYPLMR
jgi:hypothetical protein